MYLFVLISLLPGLEIYKLVPIGDVPSRYTGYVTNPKARVTLEESRPARHRKVRLNLPPKLPACRSRVQDSRKFASPQLLRLELFSEFLSIEIRNPSGKEGV